MFNFQLYNDYESRKVANDKVNGLRVSTVYTYDEGYETAIIDINGVYPVERYLTLDDAVAGHAKWLKKAPKLKTVQMLGSSYFGVMGESITLNI